MDSELLGAALSLCAGIAQEKQAMQDPMILNCGRWWPENMDLPAIPPRYRESRSSPIFFGGEKDMLRLLPYL